MQFVASQTQVERSVHCDDTNYGRYSDREVKKVYWQPISQVTVPIASQVITEVARSVQ